MGRWNAWVGGRVGEYGPAAHDALHIKPELLDALVGVPNHVFLPHIEFLAPVHEFSAGLALWMGWVGGWVRARRFE